MGELYHRICTATGLSYFGWCKDSQAARWQRCVRAAHVKCWRLGWHKLNYLHRAIITHGSGSFTHRVVERDNDIEHLKRLEQFHIATFKTMWPDGLNATAGGEGVIACAAVLAKRSASLKKTFADPERRTKMAISVRRAYEDPALRARISALTKRALNNPETRVKKSTSSRAMWQRPEFRAKQSATLRRPEVHDKWLSSIRARNPVPSPRMLKSRARSDARRLLRTIRTLQASQHALRDQMTPEVLASLKSISFQGFKWPGGAAG